MIDSKAILDLYNNTQKITKVCAEQKHAFNYWKSRNKKEPLAFDTETTGISFGVPSMLRYKRSEILVRDITVFGISLAIPTQDTLFLFWARLGTELFEEAKELLNTPGRKIAHNARYDLRVCQTSDINVAGPIDCTLTQARIYWDRRQRFGLHPLCEMICPELSDWEDEVKASSRRIKARYTRAGYPKDYTNYSFIPNKIMGPYAMTDAFLCLIVYNMLYPSMQKTYKEVYSRELQVMHLALQMENQGMQYDMRRSKKEERLLNNRLPPLEQNLYRLAKTKFNLRSPVQVLKILLALKIPQKHLTLKGKLSTDKNLLEAIVDNKLCNKKGLKFISTLLDIRAIYKLLNSYLVPLCKRASYNNGKIYCNINTADTRTGRMAVTNPGLQTIPRLLSRRKRQNPIRACFICRPGYWNYYFDYAQVEMVFYAALIGDQRILESYRKGEDIYTMLGQYTISDKNLKFIRENLGDSRQALKQLSLAVIYGAGIPGTAKILQLPKDRAASLLHDYLDACPLVTEYRDQCRYELYENGYVQDFFGRRYHIEPGQAYKAPNAVVQGSCAQVLKIALIQVNQYIVKSSDKANILFPSHDELILERPSAEQETERCFINSIVHSMNNIKQLTDRGLKMRVDVERSRKSWEDKEDI